MFVVTIGMFVSHPVFLALWPWQISRLSAIFISSIFAAILAPVIWISVTNRLAAATGGAINLAIAGTGMSIYVFMTAKNQQQIVFATVCGLLALFCAGLFLRVRKTNFQDTRSTPNLVRYSFAAFSVVLIVVSLALITNSVPMFPWPLKPAQNVLYGWIFLGASAYFIYGFLKPVYENAVGQLLGFLAYDIVLIVPYCQHFAKVPPPLYRNLVIYVIVISYSGLLAIWFLFIDKKLRFNASPQVGRLEANDI